MRYFALSKLKNSIESEEIVILQDEKPKGTTKRHYAEEREEEKCNKDMSSKIIKMIMKNETSRMESLAKERLLDSATFYNQPENKQARRGNRMLRSWLRWGILGEP